MLMNIEQGQANASMATLLRLSDALGVGLPSPVEVAQSPGLRITRAGGLARQVGGRSLLPGHGHRR